MSPHPTKLLASTALALAVIVSGCRGCSKSSGAAGSSGSGEATSVASSTASASAAPPPTASAVVIETPPPRPRCPADMVLVTPKMGDGDAGASVRPYCVDRYEATVVDKATSTPVTPYYPPDSDKAKSFFRMWDEKKGSGTELEQKTPLPPLPAWEKEKRFEPKALSKEGAVPQGYSTGHDAEHACANAAKRLCSLGEWRTACRGEDDRDFPYGPSYQAGQCNVFGPAHPGILLWDDPTINHTDPRMNVVKWKGAPLLRRTGATKTCASRWGDDAIYDMVGNVDEWIDDPDGTFLGGFYARAKKDGCQSRVTTHGIDYADYSTGIRCCKDADVVTAP